MDLQIIRSGKEKPQVLHDGYRMMFNKGPQGPLISTYFICTKRYTNDCKATLATVGDLDGRATLKYHRVEQHNHPRDVSANIVSSSLYKWRKNVKANLDCDHIAIF